MNINVDEKQFRLIVKAMAMDSRSPICVPLFSCPAIDALYSHLSCLSDDGRGADCFGLIAQFKEVTLLDLESLYSWCADRPNWRDENLDEWADWIIARGDAKTVLRCKLPHLNNKIGSLMVLGLINDLGQA